VWVSISSGGTLRPARRWGKAYTSAVVDKIDTGAARPRRRVKQATESLAPGEETESER